MLFQEAEFSRLLIIFGSQSFIIVVFSIIGFKIIKRKRERAQIALFLFYILLAFGLLLNIVSVFLALTNNELLIRAMYIISSFFILFPIVFNLLFVNIMLKLKEVFTIPKMVVIAAVYGVGCFCLYLVPDGITFSPTWIPIYSLTQLIVVYIYFSAFMTIPTIFYSFKLYRLFKAQNLKKRLRLYLIGIIVYLAVIYGAVYFITTTNQLFKTIYSVFAFFIEIISGLLVYYGVGREL